MSRIFLPMAAALLVAACTDRPPVSAPATPTTGALREVLPPTGRWAKIVTGETGPSSLYAIYVPRQWNGDAVFYVHGIRSPYDPISLDSTQDSLATVRDSLGDRGYAIAYSSFDDNGLAIKDGAQRTHQLRGLLNAQLKSPPRRSFLLGYSLGGLIALDVAESYPAQYDGLVTMCGMVGGTQLELQYIGDVRALFDYFYPNVLPGNVISVPGPPIPKDSVITLVVGAVTANPLPLFAIAGTEQTRLPYLPIGLVTDPGSPAFQTMMGSLITALATQLLDAPNVSALTHGHSPYGNRGVHYTLDTAVVPPLAPMLKAMIVGADTGVARYDLAPDARNCLEKYYQPTGHLGFPVVTVHNLWDPLVPFFHEPSFAAAVASAGASNLLLQRSEHGVAHCDFPTAVVLDAFQAMVDWATTGVRPAH